MSQISAAVRPRWPTSPSHWQIWQLHQRLPGAAKWLRVVLRENIMLTRKQNWRAQSTAWRGCWYDYNATECWHVKLHYSTLKSSKGSDLSAGVWMQWNIRQQRDERVQSCIFWIEHLFVCHEDTTFISSLGFQLSLSSQTVTFLNNSHQWQLRDNGKSSNVVWESHKVYILSH